MRELEILQWNLQNIMIITFDDRCADHGIYRIFKQLVAQTVNEEIDPRMKDSEVRYGS